MYSIYFQNSKIIFLSFEKLRKLCTFIPDFKFGLNGSSLLYLRRFSLKEFNFPSEIQFSTVVILWTKDVENNFQVLFVFEFS